MFSISFSGFYQLMVILSILIFCFGGYQLLENEQALREDIEKVQNELDTLRFDSARLALAERRLNRVYNPESRKIEPLNKILDSFIHQISENLTQLKKTKRSDYRFSRLAKESEYLDHTYEYYSDSLNQTLRRIDNAYDDFFQTLINNNYLSPRTTELRKLKNSTFQYMRIIWFCFMAIGACLFFMFYPKLVHDEVEEKRLKLYEVYKQGRIWLWCQSCGKNFSAKRSHAKNADGTTNFAFCTTCYHYGSYINPNLTSDDIWAEYLITINTAASPKQKEKLTKHFTKRLRSLARWNEYEYRDITVESSLSS